MTVTQTIISEIISQVTASFEAATGTLISGAGLAIKDIEGKVVTLNVSASGEREYIGLTDTKGTYFYIRLANTRVSETRKPANTKRGSCGIEQETRVILRLVAMHQCADAAMFAEIMKQALYTTDLKLIWPYQIASAKLFPSTTNINPWEVYTEETGKEANTLNSYTQIIAIDFELRYDYTYSDKCGSLTLC